jgi:hypothetical protein
MGDIKCVQQILEGTYENSPDTNIWTKKILQEAHFTFSRMLGAEVATMITTKDFQDYWQCVDERASSLFSGVTFLHYKAASFHTMLLVMHAAYLTACARKGILLVRWGIGLTVLLEKVV